MKNTAPLSQSQLGIYAECAGHENEVYYQLPYIYTFPAKADPQQLSKAVQATFNNHPLLFSRITTDENGEPVMELHEPETIDIKIRNISDIEQEKASLLVPMQLNGGTLYSVQILCGPGQVYLFMDLHHIICDGTTQNIILNDILKAYEGNALDPENISMAECIQNEVKCRQSEDFQKARDWYLKTFDCSDVDTTLLPDSNLQEAGERVMERTLNISVQEVDAFGKANGVFKSNYFTAAYALLLAKTAGEEESVFTTVYNGRKDKKMSQTAGMFVKTLPVYAKFDANTTTLDFLKNMQEQMHGCRDNDIFSFTDLLHEIQLTSNIMFVYQAELYDNLYIENEPVTRERINNSTTSEDINIKVMIVDGKYILRAEYDQNRYTEEMMRQHLESYDVILKEMLIREKVSEIGMTSPAQLELLDKFNQTDTNLDQSETIVSMFRKQAMATPDNTAVVYKDKRYTYREVDEISDRIAAYIHGKGLKAEDVVSVLIPRCEWMAIASLGVSKAGCAYQPLDPTYPAERLNFMMKDASAKLLIADPELRGIVDQYTGDVLFTNDIQNLPTLSEPLPSTLDPRSSSLFILLYTSGTTGTPKGCQLLHYNIATFCNWYQHKFQLNTDCNIAAYASYGFDACMMDLYPALTCGATVHIIPEEIRLDLVALNEYFEKEHVTHSFMTTQVAYQFATSIENHSLRYLLTGGEKLARLTPPNNYTLVNIYGPTECTICITTFNVTEVLKDIPIGAALDNVKLYVVDKAGRRLPVGAAGELWAAGPQVSRGYLNRPEKTAEVYVANPFETSEKYAHIYRTGDIVRYLPDGNIQFVGRKDGQVKIRGFRIELKEVESIIRQFPGIKDATVQAFDEEGGGKFIAAYIVADEQIDIEALNNFIMDEKPPYMVPAVTMQIDRIPLNQNQKVNKKALPKPEKKAAAQEVESNIPMNMLEVKLHRLVADVIKTEDFGVTTILGYVGLTSISAIRLATLIYKQFGVSVDAKSLVKNGSVQNIENAILEQLLSEDKSAKSESSETKTQATEAPLSYSQTGVYFECMKNPADTIYNIPFKMSYPATVTAEQLQKAVAEVIAAHQEMRVHFDTVNGNIMQMLDEQEPEVPINMMTEVELEDYKHTFVKPFNLSKGPLYRAEVVKTEKGLYLLLDVHHLIFDGASFDIVLKQIIQRIENQDIEKESYTYFDFVLDQQRNASSQEFSEAKTYFDQQMSHFENAAELTADIKSIADYRGELKKVFYDIDFDTISQFCTKNGITPASFMLSAAMYTLSRYINSRDVYICTISSGRANVKTADTTGMFVNTLVLSGQVNDVTVKEFINETGNTFESTLRHENYPFAQIAADYGFHPAVTYAYQVGVVSQHVIGGEPVTVEGLELNVPKFKMEVCICTQDGKTGIGIHYDDSVYSETLMTGFAEAMAAVAMNFVAHADEKVRGISMLSAAQRKLVEAFHVEGTGDSPFTLFYQAIEHYAEATPNNDALIACDARYTYAEMNAAMNRIAHALSKRGVQPRDRVALLLPRTSRLILSMFGVQKAGAAYIPCDPEYPADRIKLILEDSEARYIITTADRMETVPAEKAINVEDLLKETDTSNPNVSITADDLAYLIYTSGSTGRPKGVMLHHRGMCNYSTNHPVNVEAHLVATSAKAVLGVTTISFDASLHEIAISLYNGLALVYANEEQAKNPLDMTNLVMQYDIDYISATPSQWQTWICSDEFVKAINTVAVIRFGGEKLPESLMKQMQKITSSRLINTYGPTETTVSSNIKEVTHSQVVTVGRPQLNVKEFIVDADGNELPVGVVGELYIGGRGVARGYNNLDDKTKERFIDYQGERIYKSGDYAKWGADGDVFILGRTDNQIKLRGLRIELGEVENVIAKVEGVKNVVIMIRKLGGKEHLCAYFTADRPIEIDQMKAEISKSLTQYMVPTAYLQLDKMPMTPNGKTDMKALPDPLVAVSSEYEEPANEAEKTFCNIFADILQADRVGATDNFFELGGTSLVVTRVIIEADKAGMHVAYGEVFANPTPRQLAALVTGETVKSKGGDEIHDFDYQDIDNVLEKNTLESFLGHERVALGNVLLTGATGYLGIHLLKELIESDAETIYCLVRGKDIDAAEHRLKTLLFYYFESTYDELFGQRLRIILGDVTDDITAVVKEKIDTVFNSAAVVKHFSEGTEIEDVNIGGAQRCVDFCLATGARLIHISTTSTRGLSVNGVPAPGSVYSEQKLHMGQYLGNQYIYSKFLAERIVLQSIAKEGLVAKIMRVGNLSARSTDGEFQVNFSTNSFMGRIRVYNMLGCFPYSNYEKKVEFSPINEVAHAIILLSSTPKECCVFHPYNSHGQFLGDVLGELVNVGTDIKFVEKEEYDAALETAGADPAKAKILSSLLAYQDMAHGMKSSDVDRSNQYTCQVLYRLGFKWSATTWDYVDRMLNAISGLGFFEKQ